MEGLQNSRGKTVKISSRNTIKNNKRSIARTLKTNSGRKQT